MEMPLKLPKQEGFRFAASRDRALESRKCLIERRLERPRRVILAAKDPTVGGVRQLIDDPDEILTRLAKYKLTLKQIVITHTHIDHVGAIYELQETSGTAAAIHKADLLLLDKLGGDEFSQEDERVVSTLGSQGAVAYQRLAGRRAEIGGCVNGARCGVA